MALFPLAGSEEEVSVKILRDTAAFDSFIQASVLPFSEESDMRCSLPVLGMGMEILQVPLHNLILHSDLFQAKVAVEVRSALPVDDIMLILHGRRACLDRCSDSTCGFIGPAS